MRSRWCCVDCAAMEPADEAAGEWHLHGLSQRMRRRSPPAVWPEAIRPIDHSCQARLTISARVGMLCLQAANCSSHKASSKLDPVALLPGLLKRATLSEQKLWQPCASPVLENWNQTRLECSGQLLAVCVGLCIEGCPDRLHGARPSQRQSGYPVFQKMHLGDRLRCFMTSVDCRIRRALENTAQIVSSSQDASFTYGQGLLQAGVDHSFWPYHVHANVHAQNVTIFGDAAEACTNMGRVTKGLDTRRLQ